VAALLAMRDGFLPPTINLEHRPGCDPDAMWRTGHSGSVEHAVQTDASARKQRANVWRRRSWLVPHGNLRANA
jgi:3-oxoacyl-(acyl-carrier-protein) synthase